MNKKNYFDELLTLIGKASRCENFIGGGDMNVNLMTQSSNTDRIREWLIEGDLAQLINENTRFRVVNLRDGKRREEKSLIDHVYTNIIKKNPSVLVSHVGISDHELIQVKATVSELPKTLKVRVHDWRKYNKQSLTREIENRSAIGMHHQEALASSFEKLAPLRSIRIRENKGQIISTRIEKWKKKKDRIFKEYKETGDLCLHDTVRALTKKIKKQVKKEIKLTTQKKATSKNSKTFWKMVNDYLGNRKSNAIALSIDNKIVTDPIVLAAAFRDFFIEKVKNLAGIDEWSDTRENEPTPNPITFNQEDLSKALKEIKNKKCFGPDMIPLKVAKDFCELYPDLAIGLFNEYSARGIPQEWKTARILPLFKSGDRLTIKNYRPIANLCSMGKIFEKMVLHKLEAETLNMGGISQHGFRCNHSILTAALELQTAIASSLDEKKWVVVYSIDLSAAFDMLNVDILSPMLDGKISPELLYIIRDFITNRNHDRHICSLLRTQQPELRMCPGIFPGP